MKINGASDLARMKALQGRAFATRAALDRAALEFTTNQKASRYQATQPINNESLGRWRRYEPHLGPLKEALGPLAGA